MHRLIGAGAVTTALLATVPAAPVPADAVAPPIFPTAVGTKWVYRDEPQEWSETITAAEERDGVTVVTIEKKMLKWGGPGTSSQKIEVSRLGLFALEPDGKRSDPPRCFLKLPALPGTEWGFRCPQGPTYRMWALDMERITVPAGSYRAIPVECETRQHGATTGLGSIAHTTTDWYAPGVGLVKTQGGSYERVLLSFTPGRR